MSKTNPEISKLEQKLPLEKFIPAALMVFLLFVMFLSLLSYQNIEEYKEDVKWISHSQEVMRLNADINSLAFKVTVYRKVYLTSGDEKRRNEYYDIKNELNKEITNLKNLTRDNSVQQMSINQLDTLIKNRFVFLDSTVEFFYREKKHSTLEDELVEKIRFDLLEISEFSKRIENEEHNLLKERNSKAEISNYHVQIYIVITSLAAFLIIGIALYISNRLIRSKNSAEKLLKKSYDELEDKVEERTTELKTANENLLLENETRKKAENSLRESEERFRQMADSAPVLIWMSGKNKGFTYVSKGWTDFTGREMADEIGSGWIEGIHPDDLENCLSTYAYSFDNRLSFELEFRLRNSIGEFKWFLNKGVPRYKGDEFEGFIGICVDIQLKKRNERYLRIQYMVSRTLAEAVTTEEALQKALENICTGVNWKFGIAWIVENDKLTQKALWSENASDSDDYSSMFNKSGEMQSGEGLPGRILKENKSHWIEEIAEDENLPQKDGLVSLGWRSAFGIPISDNEKVTAVIECFNQNRLSPKEDLLEVLESVGRQIGNFLGRKRAEEELKVAYDELELRVNERTIELANTLNKLLDQMAIKEKVQNKLKLFGHALRGIRESVFITDLQSKTIFVNPSFETLYGYLESEILGGNIPVLYSDNISDEKRREIMSAALKTGWKGELVNTKNDGSEFSVFLSASVIRDEDGRVDSIVGIVQDITEEKKTRALLEKKNRLLNLLNDVSSGVNRIENFEDCLSFAINKVCEYIHWDVGHFLFYKNDVLKSSGIWNDNLGTEFEVFRAFTEEIEIETKQGNYKDIIINRKPVWAETRELSDPQIYKRAGLFTRVGLRTCIWIPVISMGNVFGILEFYNRELAEIDNEVLDCLLNIATELGSYIERNDFLDLIKEREKHFKAIADTANDVIVTANKEGKIIYVNNSSLETFGYQIDELLNHNLTMLMPEKYIEHHRQSFQNNLESGKSKVLGQTLELKGKKKDGSEFPIELSLAKWEMNGEMYFTGMIRDITHRKRIESELLESRGSLLEAQAIAKMGNWEWDVKTGAVKWSDEMFVIYELNPKEFTPSFEGFLSRLHPESKNEVKEKIENSVNNKVPFDFYERIITPAGKQKVLRSEGGVKKDAEGNVVKLVGTCLDVTEIREAEEKIRENEKRLRLIMDSIEDYAIIMLDKNGFIKSWNKGAERIKGYKEDEIIGKHISVFYRKEELDEKEPERNLEIAAKMGSFEREGWRLRKDGSIFMADIIFTSLFDEKGELSGFVKVTRDITARKKSEEALKASEKQLREAQKIAKLGSWDWNIKENKVIWSDEMYILYGVDRDTFEGTLEAYRDLIHPDDLELVRKTVERSIREKKPFNYYHKILTPAGEVKILNAQGEIHLNGSGEVERLFGISIDVTEIKEAEEQIKKSEKELKEAQSIAKLGSWGADFKTNKITWSDEMYNIHEIEPGSVSLEYMNIRKFIHPEDRHKMDSLIAKLEAGPADAELDYRIITSRGRLKYLTLDLRVELDSKGVPLRMYGSVQDITDIKLVEDELRETNARLLEAQKELVHNEKLAALGRFSSGIAHEIRNPLANISALSQLLSKLELDERSKKHLKYILINADIANKIIKDLLNFASPDDPVFDNEDIGEILNNMIESVGPRLAENKIRIVKEIQANLPGVNIDRTRMENALMNFISNAIDAMPDGGELKVSAAVQSLPERLKITISDTGIGIPQENIDKVFEPFFTTKKDGTGLGLALAFQNIKSHGGTLEIQSEPGKGTTIKITLPLKN